MSQSQCERIRELIPDVGDGRLSPEERVQVDRHVLECADCASELELARLLLLSRPTAPVGLSIRVVEAVRRDRRYVRRPWWGLSAAAVAALAIGIGIASRPSPSVPAQTPDYASELDEGQLWMSDDGLLAGAPAIDDLSDEALQELLDELSRSAGGAA